MSPPTLTIFLISSMVYFLDNGVLLKSKFPPTEVKFPRDLMFVLNKYKARAKLNAFVT